MGSTLEQVKRLCAFGVPATVRYELHSLQSGTIDVAGDIMVFLPQDTCQTVEQAIGEPTMAVTSVVFDPSYVGTGDGHPPTWLLHQVQCDKRTDFFTIWYNGGASKICYANAGTLQLSQPLSEGVKVGSGNNSGEVLWGSPLTFVSLELEGGQCATPQLLRETSISINTIALEPIQ